MSDQACQTPLTDRLCFVPIDARLTIKHSETNHSFVPVGRLCNEAAAELDRLRAELAARDAECARLRDALGWYGEEAKAIAKHMAKGAHVRAEAILASVTVLSLDGGRRADAAIAASKPKEPKP